MPDTGAPWFIPYVENTDLVSDWPTDSLALANAIVAALEDIPVLEKKIAAFTSSGTWTVPTGVTYAIAHMLGGGAGVGQSLTGTDGSDSSVAFSGGTVTSKGGTKSQFNTTASHAVAAAANSGRSASITSDASGSPYFGSDSQWGVAGAAVTPAASITVTVGAGGTAGTSGAAGGSGYVYIEYYEEA